MRQRAGGLLPEPVYGDLGDRHLCHGADCGLDQMYHRVCTGEEGCVAAEYCGEVGCGAGAECATGAEAGDQNSNEIYDAVLFNNVISIEQFFSFMHH